MMSLEFHGRNLDNNVSEGERILSGPALRKEARSRKVDKCGTVLSYGTSDMPIIRARSSAETRV
jgi:hypothetical protein